MPHLSVNGLPPQPQPQPIGPEPGGPQQVGPQQPGGLPDGMQQPVVQPGGGDPVVAEVQENGAGWPNFEPGHGQLRQLVQAHNLGSGRDWDIESAQGAAELASKSAKRIRDMVSGETALRQYEQNVSAVLDRLLAAHPDAADAIGPDYAELLRTIGVVRELRATFASGIKDGSNHADDPRAALASIRKHLRIFRYETQQVLSSLGFAAGAQERGEHAMRAIQNFFTFGAKHHVSLDEFSAIRAAEEEMYAAAGRFCQTLRRLDPQASDPRQPPNLALRHALPSALEFSHRTNDRIRAFQDADSSSAGIRDILGKIPSKGGSRTVEFTVGAGALVGLGFPGSFAAGLRAGANFKLYAEVSVPTGGGPLTTTFRIGGGVEAKALLRGLPLSDVASVKVDAGVEGSAEHFVTRTYATVEDLILDARRNRLALAHTVFGYIGAGFCKLGGLIGKLGCKAFRWMGRRSDEIKQTASEYLDLLKHRGVVGSLDQFLARRANPMVVGERRGVLLTGSAGAQASGNVAGFVDLGANANISRSIEVGVSSTAFVPAARTIRASADPRALLRAGPGGGDPAELPPAEDYDALAASFEALVEGARGSPPRTDPEWADFANAVRTHLIAAEALHRDGVLTRGQADLLLARFSDPGIRIPPDIYREYLMDGAGAAKPPKIRTTGKGEISYSALSAQTGNLVGGIVANPFARAVATGVADVARRNVGLAGQIRYTWSREKPVDPGADPRPWENTVKTTCRLSLSSTAPVRAILDHIARTKIQARTGTLPGTEVESEIREAMIKDLALTVLPKLLLAGAKEGAKAWLSKPENIKKLVKFVLEHIDIPLDLLAAIVNRFAEDPGKFLDDIFTAFVYIRGTDVVWKTERLQTLEWSYEDGNLVQYSLYDDTTTKSGISVDPVGVGLGVSANLSYTVGESVKKQGMMVNPTLVTLLGKTEQYLFADTSARAPGNSEPFKSWICNNMAAIDDTMQGIRGNTPEALGIKAKAIETVANDPAAVNEIETAWRAVRDLPDDALPETRLEAYRHLLTTLTTVFRSPLLP